MWGCCLAVAANAVAGGGAACSINIDAGGFNANGLLLLVLLEFEELL